MVIRIFTDAAHYPMLHSSSIAFTIDRDGQRLVSCSMKLSTPMKAGQAEIKAITEALNEALRQGLASEQVALFTDAESIPKVVWNTDSHKRQHIQSRFGELLELSKQFKSVHFLTITHRGNREVHRLAKAAARRID